MAGNDEYLEFARKVAAPTTEQLVDNVLRKARASRGAPVREQDQATRPQPAPGPTDGRVTELVSRVLDGAARFVRGTGLLRGRRKSRDSEPPQEPDRTQAPPTPPPGPGAGTGGARSDAPDSHFCDGGKNAEDIFWSGEKVPETAGVDDAPDAPSLLSSPWELSATGVRSQGSGIGGLSPVPWQGGQSRAQEPCGAYLPVDSPSFQLEEEASVSRLSLREPSSLQSSAACRFHVRSSARSPDVPDGHANVFDASIASEETGQSPVHFDLAPESPIQAPAAPQQTLAKDEKEERQQAEKEVRDLKATIAELEERLQQQDEQLQLNKTRQQELSDDLEEARRAAQEHQQAAAEARQHIEKEVTSPHPSSSSVQQAPSPVPECASLSPLQGDVGKEPVHTWRHPAGEVFLSAVQACLPTLAASPASTASRSPPQGRHAHRGILAVPEEAYKANPSQHGGIAAHEAEVGHQHDDRLRALEKCMEETRRQLEVCLETAARSRSPVTSPVQAREEPTAVRVASPERGHSEASPAGHPCWSECPTIEVPDAHLQACLLLRSRLANTLDPPELLQKAQAMLRLKAAVGEIYAVLCLQTKAKSFLAQSRVAELAQRRRPRPQTAGSGRSTQPRGALNRSPLPPSEALRRRATVQAVADRGRGDEAASGVTARRRWSSCPRPESVPPLALELVQFGERPVPRVSPVPPEAVARSEMPASEEAAAEAGAEPAVEAAAAAAARGSAVFAARSLLEKDGSKPTRPMSSPALLAQPREPRVVAIRPRQIKSASMARQSMPARSRPASGISRSRKAGGWEKSDIGNSQAELWLIKQRTLAGMLWPPMSEAARGRRPGAGCARPLRKAISDQQGCGCKPEEVQPLALKFAMAEAEILREGEAS